MSHYDDKMTVLQKMQGQTPQVSKSNPVPEALSRLDKAVATLAEATSRLLGRLEAAGVLTGAVETCAGTPPQGRPISCPLEDEILSIESKILHIGNGVTSCHQRLCV